MIQYNFIIVFIFCQVSIVEIQLLEFDKVIFHMYTIFHMARKYNIKSKPTKYSKVVYRSRLEVRWAVFFKALGVAFEYEPMAFYTSLGGYLPDFYLSKTDWFVEIKPTGPTNEESIKAKDVSGQGSKIVILSGPPDVDAVACFFQNGKEVFFEASYYQRISKHWQTRPPHILKNIVWLKTITGKKSFGTAFKKAREYKFGSKNVK